MGWEDVIDRTGVRSEGLSPQSSDDRFPLVHFRFRAWAEVRLALDLEVIVRVAVGSQQLMLGHMGLAPCMTSTDPLSTTMAVDVAG